tara:strand:+ start:101 stop:292 length:192 start_codon:yes stop_codon:yes gene_type:complete
MTDLVVDSFPIWKAILWIFYPMAALVMFELLLRGFDDDDDDDGGKGIRIFKEEMTPAYAPTGA